MLSRYSTHAVLCCALLFSSLAVADGDPARGKILADTCEGCHASEGYNNVYPTYHVPKIGGQSADYLAAALRLYRAGDREHPTMVAQAQSMTDQDIDDIAAYVAGAGTKDDSDSVNGNAPGTTTACAACHGPAGRSPLPQNPSLAGQYQDYLRHALDQYRTGARKGANAIVMQAQILSLDAADLDAIAAFYAQQDGLAHLPRE
jgi:cytochrome c553